MWKAGLTCGAACLVFVAAFAGVTNARPGGGGHGGGGGGGRGGGGPHFSGARGGGGAHVHFGGAGPRFHVGGVSRGHLAGPRVAGPRAGAPFVYRGGRGARAAARPFVGHRFSSRAFAARPVVHGPGLRFAAHGEARPIRPFLHGSFGRRHISWIGPLFWPYAYGDFFYYSMWPYAYDDPFWSYGYDDIYAGVFWPYGYEDVINSRSSRVRLAARPGIRPGIRPGVGTELCIDETREIAGWPIDRIQEVVQPNEQQQAALDELGSSTVKASEVVKAGCPTTIAFTPVGRLDAVEKRISALIQAVGLVRPPLEKFYDSLTDEQKARFNELGARDQRLQAGHERTDAKPVCGAVTPMDAWPTSEIERALKPSELQRANLDELQATAAKAADMIKASCPTETPSTPPARLAAVAQRLDAMLEATKTMRAAVDKFYSSLDDVQKARFNTIGRRQPGPRG